MNNLDERIRAALAADSEEAAALSREPGLFRELFTAVSGRFPALGGWILFLQIVALGVFLWTAVEFLRAEEVAQQLRWGGGALLLFLFMSFVKIWFWLEMQTNRVLREIKRVELLLVRDAESRPAPPRE